ELKVVIYNMVQVKAKTLTRTQRFLLLYPDISVFQWSYKWLDGFMNYYNLNYDEKQQEFLSFVLFQRMKYEYSLNLISNMDETLLSFDLPNNFTIDETGARSISIRTCRYEKSNFIVVLGCMSDGSKLLPLILFKLKNVSRLEFLMGVKIRTNQKGWINTDEMLFWIENVWNYHAPHSVDPRSLLKLDLFHVWDDIDLTLIRLAFKCCGISNNHDGSEDIQIFDYNFSKANSSTSYIFSEEENSNESVENHEGSSKSDKNYEGSNQLIESCDNDEGFGQSSENNFISDFGDKNFDEHYNDLE
ncbi:8091_t:CDS:2, partial [Scutellospora calospora]